MDILQNFVLNMVVHTVTTWIYRTGICRDVSKMQTAIFTVIYNKIQDSEKKNIYPTLYTGCVLFSPAKLKGKKGVKKS